MRDCFRCTKLKYVMGDPEYRSDLPVIKDRICKEANRSLNKDSYPIDGSPDWCPLDKKAKGLYGSKTN